jgi:transmembrane sensor
MSWNSDKQANDQKLVVFPEPRTIESQAARWLAKLDAENPSREDIEAFKQWIAEDKQHRQEFESLVNFWDEMNVLTQVVTPRERAWQSKPANRGKDASKRLNRRFAIAGTALATMLMAVLVNLSPWQWSSSQVYVTAVGEQKEVTLPDNTKVSLNTNSRFEVHYSEKRRGVYLMQGEAHFDVHHDADRPFEVYVGNSLVRALGTAFAVHLMTDKNVEVIVTEGVVEIGNVLPQSINSALKQPAATTDANTSKNDKPDAYTRVSAGKKATLTRDAEKQVILAEIKQLDDKLSWRKGVLVFQREPLERVVNEMSRYTSMKIVIPERQLRELEVGGIFKIGDTESLFEALRHGFGVHVEYVSDDYVYLASGQPQ